MAIMIYSGDSIWYSAFKQSQKKAQRCLLSVHSVGVLICEPGNTNYSCSFDIELHLLNELQLPRCLKPEWLGPLYVVVSLQQPSLPSWFLANHRTITLPGGWSQSPYPSKVPSVKSCCVPLFLSFTLKKCCIHLKFIFELPVLLILLLLLLLLSLMNSLGFYHDCLSHRAHFVLHGHMTEIPRGSGGEVALPSIATVGKHCIVVFSVPRFLSFLCYCNYFIYLFGFTTHIWCTFLGWTLVTFQCNWVT